MSMRRNTPEEKEAMKRVIAAAREAALKEGIRGVGLLVVLPRDNQVSCTLFADTPEAFAELVLRGADCFAGFAQRIASDQLTPLDPASFKKGGRS